MMRRRSVQHRLDQIETKIEATADFYELTDGRRVKLPPIIDLDLLFYHWRLGWRRMQNTGASHADYERWTRTFARTVPRPGEGAMAVAAREACQEAVAGLRPMRVEQRRYSHDDADPDN